MRFKQTVQIASVFAMIVALGSTQQSAHAQVWSSLINEGSTPPGTPVGYAVSTINAPKINGVGGWAIVTNLTGSTPVISSIYGAPDGVTPPGFLRFEGTVAGLLQNDFNTTALGLDDLGRPLYRCGSVVGGTDESAVFIDDSLLVQQGTFIVGGVLDGYEMDLYNGPDMNLTQNGVAWSVARVRSPSNVLDEAVIRGTNELIMIGQTILPGMATPLDNDSSATFGRLSVSPNGLEYIVEAQLETTGTGVPTSANEFMVYSGSPMRINGQIVQEGQPVPGGLPGENFGTAFDPYEVNDFGDVIMNISSTAAAAQNEIIIVRGQIVLREGTPIGGVTLGTTPESLAINSNGDWVVAWNTTSPTGECIIFNGNVILKRGDPVDLNNNGDPNDDGAVMAVVNSFQGYGLQISDRDASGNVTIYANLDVDTNGSPTTGEVEGLYRITLPTGTPTSHELQINVTVSPDPGFEVPGQIEYTVSVRNNSPTSSTGVTVTSTLPTGVAYNSGDPVTSPSGNDVIGNIGNLGPYEVFKYRFLCDVTTPGLKSVTSVVAANEADPIPANNSITVSSNVEPIVELALSIVDSPDPQNVQNGPITYTIQVTNNGPSAASGIIVNFTLDGTTTFSSTDAVAIHDGSPFGGVVTADISGPNGLNGPLPNGQSFSFGVVVLPTVVGTINVSGSVLSNETDRTPANNNAAAATTYALISNLAVAITDAADPISPGADITYTVTVSNAGPTDATGVVADFVLDPSTSLISVTAPGAPNGPNVQAGIGNLASGGQVSFDVVVSTSGLRYTHASATVTGGGVQVDPNLGNNNVEEVTAALPHAIGLTRPIFSDIVTDPSSDVPGLPGRKFTNFKRPWRSPNGENWIIVGEIDQNISPQNDSDGGADDDVIIRSVGGFVETVAQEGVSLDDLGEPYGAFDEQLSINDNGDFAFATDTNTTLNVPGEIIVKSVSNVFTTVAREDDINLAVIQLYNFDLRSPVIQNNGSTWFYALLGADVNSITGRAFFSDDGGALQLRNASGYVPQNQVTNPTWAWYDWERYQMTTNGTGSSYLVRGRTSSTPTGGSFRRIVGIGTAGNPPATATTVVLEEGVPAAGFASPIKTGTVANYAWMAPNGDWYARGTNNDNEDWVIRNGAVLAKSGDPVHSGTTEAWHNSTAANALSPSLTGVAYFVFAGNNNGDSIVGGYTVSRDNDSNVALVYNNERIIVRENDPIDMNGNGLLDDDLYISRFGEDDLIMDESGHAYMVVVLRNANGTEVGDAFVAIDLNCNGIYGDLNSDGFVDGADLQAFTECVLVGNPAASTCRCADMNLDGLVDLNDIDTMATVLTYQP
ncbi:MAG: DUF11 domain-containing protein [Phycisphaerae bacterium]|nr:DUF11 domain-containing protein [Phycisphaerae bacterium]